MEVQIDMATIKIEYSAISAPVANAVAQICVTFLPTNAAADLPPFDGTYYDTNVQGWGEGTALETFFAQSVAHPGLFAAIKLAMEAEDGTYEFETSDDKTIIYADELAKVLKDEGFTITVTKN